MALQPPAPGKHYLVSVGLFTFVEKSIGLYFKKQASYFHLVEAFFHPLRSLVSHQMRLLLFIITLCLLETPAYCQQKPITVTATSYNGPDVILSVRNTGFCPYTIVLTCELTNMTSSVPLPLRVVVQPSKKTTTLARLTPMPGRPSHYSFNYRYYLGNSMVAPTTEYVYSLPFEEGKEYTVIQSNNGSFSHMNKQAIDFQMPENTVVCATRNGVVVELRQDSNSGCPDVSCKDQGNYITVYHQDGSYASYVHFRQNGSLVQLGQQVAKGEPIGYSGNTGWSSGPHLHFEVDAPSETERISLPVTFGVAGQLLKELQKGSTYKR